MFPTLVFNFSVVVSKRMVQKDPRKLALVGHWDGFQVSGKKQWGCWAMEIDVLNANTSSCLSLIPILFIPLGGNPPYIIKQMKENLTAFITPFVEELEAQSKIANLKSSGKAACRRCKMHSELVDGQYVYSENERQFVHLLERQTAKELRQSGHTYKVEK